MQAFPPVHRCAPSTWRWRARLWWLLWVGCPGVGPKRVNALICGFGSLEAAWQATLPELAIVCGWSDRLLGAVDTYRLHWGADPLGRASDQWQRGRRVLLPGDRRWPKAIQRAHPPPLALYWAGRGSLWCPLSQRKAVAVVGTRRPSRHGLTVARQIGAVLAHGGWPVVSGLAAGIDGAVHRACLEAKGVPIGVLGTPLERVYPRHHASLQAVVGERGLLVSEMAPHAPVSKGSFARRNRLQVALACAVILVECPMGSGALHSAELALREGLPLWVVPADTGRPSAAGSNSLLAKGASPLNNPADLLPVLGEGPIRLGAGSTPDEGCQKSRCLASSANDHILAALGDGASMEELCSAVNLSPEALLPPLLDLEASGAVIAEPGLFWRRCPHQAT
jgi:DNA processing protein